MGAIGARCAGIPVEPATQKVPGLAHVLNVDPASHDLHTEHIFPGAWSPAAESFHIYMHMGAHASPFS